MPYLKSLAFDSGQAGPAFLVTGAVHGNEKCGTAAIGQLIMEIEAGLLELKKGRLVCVPICNPKAYAQNSRQYEVNLNRVMIRHLKRDSYEHHLANELADIIDQADIFLDLHSYSSGVKPFLFIDHDTPRHRAFAASLGIPHWITGWDDLYADRKDLNAGDTTGYANSQGKLSLLIECGQHEDPASIVNGYHALRAALAYAGLTDPYDVQDKSPPQIHRMTEVVMKDRVGHFVKKWQHLDPIKKGDPVIAYDDGGFLIAPEDGVIVMPAPNANMDSDWIYFGRKDD